MGKPRTRAVGIDLGTTNSVIAVVESGKPQVIPNSDRERIMPSVVALLDGGQVLVGLQAKRQAVLNPSRTISSAKRLIGSRMSDLAPNDRQMPYKVIADSSGATRMDLGNGELASPEEIGATIIRHLIKDASDFLGEPVTEAVITVPAYFNDAQRQATKNAGTIAGIEVLRIINEPTAAALAYGLEKRRCENILVFDLGGGTFDVSILDVQENVCEVIATSGDTHLGGDDFDRALLDWIADEFKTRHGVDLRSDPQARARLTEAVERAKCDLSLAQQTTVDLPFITTNGDDAKHLTLTITREKFEELTQHLVKRCSTAVTDALRAAKLEPKDIDEVLLVGGSTRIPAVRKLVKELMNGLEPSMNVSPDEVVALGAAVQAAIIKGDLDDLVLLDVTPFSLGLYTEGGKMEKMIERNTAIPTRETKLFSTSQNFQRGVDIVILQGESEIAKENAELGRFALDGIKNHFKGEAEIEICFDIDESGILHVSAKDLQTELQQKLVITGTTNLKQEEVRGMAINASNNAARDAEQRMEIETKQQAQYAIHRAEELLRGLATDIPRDVAAVKANCEALLNGVREAVERNVSERKLRKLKSSLDQAVEQLSQHR